MINLIPVEEKARMNKDFYLRFLIVAFVMFGILFLMASVAIFPSYMLLIEKKSTINTKLKTQENEVVPEVDQKASNIIEDLNKKIETVTNSQSTRYDVSIKVVKEILYKKTLGIQITQIHYKADELEKKTVIINGIASNRERLLDFRKNLERDTMFSNVDLPISNFVNDSDIEFNLTLIPL